MKTEKKFILTEDDIFALLKEAYRHGFSTCDMVEAGLERYERVVGNRRPLQYSSILTYLQ